VVADGALAAEHDAGAELRGAGDAGLAGEEAVGAEDDVVRDLDERDGASRDRRAAALAFLKDAGLAESQVEIVFGQNPENWSPAARQLQNLPKTDTGTEAGTAAKGTDASASGTDKATGTSTAGGGNDAGGGGVNLFK